MILHHRDRLGNIWRNNYFKLSLMGGRFPMICCDLFHHSVCVWDRFYFQPPFPTIWMCSLRNVPKFLKLAFFGRFTICSDYLKLLCKMGSRMMSKLASGTIYQSKYTWFQFSVFGGIKVRLNNSVVMDWSLPEEWIIIQTTIYCDSQLLQISN